MQAHGAALTRRRSCPQMAEFMRQHLPNLSFFKPQTGSSGSSETNAEAKSSSGFQFDKKPREVKAYLDRYVIKQDEAKKVLSVALCDHYEPLWGDAGHDYFFWTSSTSTTLSCSSRANSTG